MCIAMHTMIVYSQWIKVVVSTRIHKTLCGSKIGAYKAVFLFKCKAHLKKTLFHRDMKDTSEIYLQN